MKLNSITIIILISALTAISSFADGVDTLSCNQLDNQGRSINGGAQLVVSRIFSGQTPIIALSDGSKVTVEVTMKGHGRDTLGNDYNINILSKFFSKSGKDISVNNPNWKVGDSTSNASISNISLYVVPVKNAPSYPGSFISITLPHNNKTAHSLTLKGVLAGNYLYASLYARTNGGSLIVNGGPMQFSCNQSINTLSR
jgi:hypothetical protein